LPSEPKSTRSPCPVMTAWPTLHGSGSGKQMFGADEQVPYGGQSD
jgi:hypothetical protein